MSTPQPHDESEAAVEPPTTLSTVALVLGVLSLIGVRLLIAAAAVCAVLAVVLGAVSLNQIRHGTARGQKRAIVAVILGGLGVIGVGFMLASFGA